MSISTPDWVKNAVFYQIFPDRFSRGYALKPPISKAWEPWLDPPTSQGYKGGTLWGVIEQLDYLVNLGITALYLTPIFQSACNHRYHTHDYYQIDPLLGGNEAFQALLRAAHQRQIKLVLDGVFNHASRGFFQFHDILENGPYSPWLDWFKIEGWPLAAYQGERPANYLSWAENRALPQFNHAHPQVREYLMQVAEYWIKQGIDGWRLDVPDQIQVPGFWQEFRDRIKALNPDAYIVGEIWGNAQEWLAGDQFDGVMNYPFTAATIAFVAGDHLDPQQVSPALHRAYKPLTAQAYGLRMQTLLEQYPWHIQLTQLNLLASHDTARLLTIAQGDRASVELATLLLMTFPGAPCIYYGDEVGLPGGLDPDCRRGFPPQANWDLGLAAVHQQLISLRHRFAALRIGQYQVLAAGEDLYLFCRYCEDQGLIIAVNKSNQQITTSLELDTESLPWLWNSEQASLLYGTGTLETSPATGCPLTIQLPPRQGSIWGPYTVNATAVLQGSKL
ncbi:MAG: alpha-amylase [Acaryochloridaceae cyanobacterium SU_2_1]|nr:alpha-amylase [Acaryochloridaceae cyanobacterium SU_2_1]